MNRRGAILSLSGIFMGTGLLCLSAGAKVEKKTEPAGRYLYASAGTKADEESGSDGQYLQMFAAPWCGPCKRMEPLLEKLEKEEGIRVDRYDIATSTGRAKFQEMGNKADPPCAAIPFFFNSKTSGSICGATDYEHLRSWALQKNKK